jgi:PAS domain S-box-containing protein
VRTNVLKRQLRRCGLAPDVAPTLDEWRAFLAVVERTYDEVEQDRYTLERSLAISSEEMRSLYDDLKRSSESQLAAEHRKLRKNITIHEAILEAALDGVLVVDEERRVVSHSRRFDELWGLPSTATEEDITPLRASVAAPQTIDPADFLARTQQIYASDKPSQDEIVLADGRVLDRTSSPIRADTGESYGRVWFFRDVTARKQQDDRLREANRFLDSIVENIPHMVFVKEAATLKFVRFNRAGEQLLGMSEDALIGKSDHDFFPAEQADFFVGADRKVLAQRGIVTIDEEPIATPHGTRWLRTKKIPILAEDGTPQYLLGISEDITEPRLRSAELLAAKETAEKASRAKSDFLLNMSHEMRTPLNAILGFARVLEREAASLVSPDHREFLQYMVQAAEHMLALVSDLLDLRSLEAQQLPMAATELGPVIEETAALLRPLIDERGLAMTIELGCDLPLVLANRRAVVQILINLISNAAKFTPPGGTVALQALHDASRVSVSVRDTGIGIASEDQAKLFTYFEQVGEKHAHHMKGSGVGLALTRALVERQGGSISVRSVPRVGSTFKFDLKVAP